MIYVLTLANAVILAVVAYLFFTFRKALDSSGVRQIDDYLHELEGSVAQLTEQFERSSTKISKDLLRKTTELQALIGEADTKLAQMSRLKAPAPDEALTAPHPPEPVAAVGGGAVIPAALAARRMSAADLLATKPPDAVHKPANGDLSGHAGRRVLAGASQQAAAARISSSSEPGPAANGEHRSDTPGAGQPNEKYRLIFLLASEGMDAASIAKHTNLTRGEVEMLLDLRRQGKL